MDTDTSINHQENNQYHLIVIKTSCSVVRSSSCSCALSGFLHMTVGCFLLLERDGLFQLSKVIFLQVTRLGMSSQIRDKCD